MNRKTRLRWLCTLALAAGCGGEPSGPPGVSTVEVQPASTSVTVGLTTQLSAILRDRNGNVLTGRNVTWSSTDESRALVSSSGLVTGVGAGNVSIRATSEGVSNNAAVSVTLPPTNDFSVVDAQFTQAIQSATGSVPIVLNGNAAVVNVLIRAAQASATPVPIQVVLRLFEANGTPIRTDTAVTTGTISTTTTYAAPNAQFLVPANVLRQGLRWQVEVDPRRVTVDENRVNNLFPQTGTNTILSTTVPVLKVRFIPIVLAAHNNSTVAVTTAQMPEYLRVLRSVHPLGVVTPTIGTPFTTNSSFGTPPRGGESPFWTQLLGELDMARVVDPGDPEVHWFGLMRPPTGFNFTSFGGFGYIPSSATTTGASTRTALAVAPGWFSNQAQSRELIAHELGHNFTRRHAPCGSPANPDVSFPQPNGTIGIPGHDVYSWANALSNSATTMDASTGDVMGYCSPAWVSLYTYGAVLNARGTGPVAAVAGTPARTRVLVIRGQIVDDRVVQFEPVFSLDGRVTYPERSGRYRMEGRDDSNRILFSSDFEPAEIDHAPNTRAFLFAVEATPEIEAALSSIEVRSATASARITSRPAFIWSNARRAPSLSRGTQGVAVACADAAAAIAVVEAETGTLLGTSRTSTARIASTAGRPLVVACSDGIRTTRFPAITP
jgi:hypothetical protein